MRLRLIRNATLKLAYAGRTILIDPYFAPRHSLPSYTGKSKNPLVELPLPVDEILSGVDLVIISHLHSDHFDSVAKERVPKHLPILCQPVMKRRSVQPFRGCHAADDDIAWNGISITRREGSHGLGPVLEAMGSVMGISVNAVGEPHLYWLGDTVLYPPVLETIQRTQPDVIVSHSCGAYWGKDLIVMDVAETVALC